MKTKSRCKLKLAIAVRHGEYDQRTVELNKDGVKQMRRVAERLRVLVKSKHKVEVFSSPLARAKQSAQIIADTFGVPVEVCDELFSDCFQSGGKQMRSLLSKRNGSDVVIAVAHFVAPSGIINAFSEKFFQKKTFKAEMECAKGNGIMIDLKTGVVTKSLLKQLE